MSQIGMPAQVRSRVRAHRTRRQIAFTMAKWAISLGLLAWIFRDLALGEIMASIYAADAWLLLLACSLNAIGWTLTAYRWRTLLAAQGVQTTIPFLFNSYAVSMFFSNLLPSTIGGDAVRIYDSWRLGCTKASAVAVVFVDRFTGLLALMFFTLVALSMWGVSGQSLVSIWIYVLLGSMAMVAVIWLALFPPNWLLRGSQSGGKRLNLLWGKVASLLEAFAIFRGQTRALVWALIFSLLLQANVVLYYYLIATALHIDIPLTAFFLIVPLTIFIMMVPISVNAIGLRENAFIFFFALYGTANSEAVALAWIAYAIVLLQGIVGGVVYLLRREGRPG